MAGKSANQPSFETMMKNSTKRKSPEEIKKEEDEYYDSLRKFSGIFKAHDYVDDKGKPIDHYKFSRTSLFCLTD